MTKYSSAYESSLFQAFHDAALFLQKQMKTADWKWSSNYLREHVRCTTGMKFSNSISPRMLRKLRTDYPELRAYIEIGTLKGD